MRLDGAGFAIRPLCDIEDDGVRVKLRRNVTIDGASRVVFELCGDKLASGLRQMVAADARLRIAFERIERGGDRLAVRLAHAKVSANKSC